VTWSDDAWRGGLCFADNIPRQRAKGLTQIHPPFCRYPVPGQIRRGSGLAYCAIQYLSPGCLGAPQN